MKGSKVKILEDVFEHQLKDLYRTENPFIKAKPKAMEQVADRKKEGGYRISSKWDRKPMESDSRNLQWTEYQGKRQIMQGHKINFGRPGILAEGDEKSMGVSGTIAYGQGIEHYERSGHGRTVNLHKSLILPKWLTLQKILNKKLDSDEKLDRCQEGGLRVKRKPKSFYCPPKLQVKRFRRITPMRHGYLYVLG